MSTQSKYRLLIIFFMIFISRVSFAQALPHLRISTENNASHVQTRVVQMFVDRLSEKLRGKLEVELYHSAELFRDSNVVKAIADGKVQMAVPGTWQIDKFEPNVGLFLLPMFYGRDAEVNYTLRDGEVGQAINQKIGETLGVKVIGRWIDLGYAHLYGVKHKINSYEDLVGMSVRIAGGDANALRIEALGASPRVVPWPDLPQALKHGNIDGILTTHATIVSANLWEKGVDSAFEDKEYFAQYVPMVSQRFWNRIPQETQQAIKEAWESVIEESRLMAVKTQQDAYATLKENGVRIVTPSAEDRAKHRKIMMLNQPALVKKLGIAPFLVEKTLIQLNK
ncbi:MAG: TRAP transporter substrate-binding protein DctP [Gammaproteobacteria bacterium]|jgi:TRAP-type C4-dicarboxylate transport system substrate-binding protein|nr:TRAP transporter substrate-binding protein DctP [Gammaproteobacteria bacterium]MBT3723627.1 TRAP transporter substrate-binding protein DctP [Gammaproteobacteria bacterium]MBT4077380.1 TRAP transporter substrate-binding protein DctP [Gammaproteobacteria bacterium]MBT4195241.1 TRAP transporter substrate-binding protein DctP [Gammaproteobacteria bacterium]MBT4451990.1 TRAP transporter substrate-binding protein DctP [Gammaproteobacteria bacterium]